MRRNVTVLFFLVLFSLSFSEVYAQDYALWPNSPGIPTSISPTTSGNVQASAMTYYNSANLASYTSYSSGTKTIASYIGFLISNTAAWGTSWTSTGTNAVYEQYVISPASGYNLNMTGVELYLGCSNTSGSMKVQLAYSTDGTNFTTFASNSAVNSTITAAGGGQNGLYLSNTGGMTTGASTSAFTSRVNYWSTSFNSTALSVANGGSFFLRVYPYNTVATTSHWLAVANVKLKGTASSAGTITPAPTSYNFGNVVAGSSSGSQSFTLTASGLSANISVSAPSGFEVSNDNSTWGSTTTVNQAGGTLYARYSPSSGSGGTGTVNITLTSNSTSANIGVQGFGYAAEPTSQSTISFGTVDGSSIVLNLPSAGNGSNHLVVAKSGSAVDWAPSDLTDYTSGTSTVFGTAADQGSGNKVVYNGTGSGSSVVTVTGLSAGTTYHFAVYDFNIGGAASTQNYYTTSPGTGNQTTATNPTLTPSAASLTSFGNVVINSTSTEKSFTISGAYLTGFPDNIAVAAPAGFEVSLSSGSGFASSVNVPYTSATLSATTIYVHMVPTAITSYSGNIACTGGGASQQDVAISGSGVAVPAPTSLAVAHTSDNIVHLTWTSPANTYEKVLVFARAGGDITHSPSGTGSGYNNANSDITSAGVYSTDNYLVYAGTGTSLEVTGLSAGTTYYFNAYAYEGNAWSSAAASVNASVNVQEVTSLAGAVGTSQVALSWTNPTYYNTQSNYWDEVLVVGRLTSANDGTPSGDGSSYTANTTFGQGTALGSGFVVYKGTSTGATVTNLADGSTYYFKAFVRHGSVWSSGSEINKTIYPYANNDLGTSADNTWATASIWKKWNSSTNTWDTYGSVPTSADNVWILNNVTVSVSGINCKDLHIASGVTLKGNSALTTPKYLNVYGTTIDVQGTGSFGTTAAGDAADALGINLQNVAPKISGSSTSNIAINRMQFYVTGTTLEIAAHNVTINYHGSSNTGNASGLCVNSSSQDNIVVKIDAGDTLTFAPWSCILGASSSSTGIGNYNNMTFNIYGTLQMTPGTPAGNSSTPTWGAGYISAAANTGKTFAMHVFNGGTLNATKFFSNGCPELTSYPAPGTTSLIVDAGGVMNFASDTTDFTNTAVITGNGTVNINGSPFFIGSASGITASSAAGPIQTTTRNYGSSLYEYVGTSSQATGDGLPSTVTGLKIRNSSGVSLSSSVNVNGTLTLSSGTFTVGANTLTLNNPIAGTVANLSAGNTSSIAIAGSASDINIPSGVSALNNFTLNNTNGSTLQTGLTLNGTLTLTAGQLSLGANTLALNGAVTASSGTISGSTSSTVSVGGSGSALLPAGSYYNLTLNRSSGALLNGAASVAGTLTLASGALDQNSNTLTINSGASVLYNGGSVTPALSMPSTITNYTPPAGTTINSTTVNGTVTLSNGSLTIASGQTLTLGASGSIGTESAGSYVVGIVQANPVAINASTATNIAGLGVTIAPGTNNLGNTTVIRTSGAQGYVSQGDGSINRRWKITPTSQPSTSVDVTLSWVSDDDNGKNIASLAVWKSENDGTTWEKVAGGLNGSSRTVTFSTSSFSDFTLLGDNEVLPVELSALSAKVAGRNVLVEWTTATEVNSFKFVVERRKSGSSQWIRLGEVMASKYSNSPKNYSLDDKSLNSGKYSYRLQLVDNDGSYEYSQITAEAEIAIPKEFSLSQNYPNPFNPTTKITYALPSDSHVTLELYAISGQKIATLLSENAEAGYYDVPVNMSSYGLASGMYIYRFSGKELNSGKQFTSVKKMMLLK